MAILLTDKIIQDLIAEKKPLANDPRGSVSLKAKRAHSEWQETVTGAEGSEFRVIIRSSRLNPLDFSVILAYVPRDSNLVVRLRRYNGKHWHTNSLEGDRLHGFHIHQATQRYQEIGAEADAYARETTLYSDLHGALDCLMRECGFQPVVGSQTTIYDCLE